jgi:hypothetical protein
MERRSYGTGNVTPKGYIRINGDMAHRRVWRKHRGRVPVGFFIHHIDGNKQNNDIANLELVDALTHKRIHSGCRMRDGEWWKPCRKCGELKRVSSDFYTRKPSGISPWCKSCCVRNAVGNKRRRKLEAIQEHP